ncbi:hypothetical protein [Polyangium spumosum]|uniref:Secreted protein n=1 Tax=Polyangium spumosum TaxID=889282 RepID=A0A6N7PV15_9BACT|nr:hypothetical protein [Polyangium spumosum]MRG95407.1 hypothetical protein [Polyangium spumosum]
MHRHPWRIVRALRVLLACLVLLLPAAPARSAPAVVDTVLVVAYTRAAAQVARAAPEVAPRHVEAPRAEVEAPPRKVPSFVRTEPLAATAPDASSVPVPAERWLLHCALLC